MFQPNYQRPNINISVDSQQLLDMTSKPFRGMQYTNFPRSHVPEMKINKMPQLMKTRAITGMRNSEHFPVQHQLEPEFKQTTPVLNRHRLSLDNAIHLPSISRNFNEIEPSTSSVNTSLDTRKRNISIGISEITMQDNLVPISRSSNNSRATSIASSRSSFINHAVEKAGSNNFNFKVFGSTETEKTFIFTGTVDRVIKWNKIFRNHFCYYEVIASVVSIQEGSLNSQKIMLLRDKKGPILQVVYYTSTHLDIEDFHVEQVLRCVGRMNAPNILNAVSIRSATQEEIETLQRLCLVCDQAISHFLSV